MIGEYISALSNSAELCERPKAYLIWGVQDDTHKIVGTEFQYRKMKKGNEELEAWLSHMLLPRINFRFYEVPMDQEMVILLKIPCAEKQPVRCILAFRAFFAVRDGTKWRFRLLLSGDEGKSGGGHT